MRRLTSLALLVALVGAHRPAAAVDESLQGLVASRASSQPVIAGQTLLEETSVSRKYDLILSAEDGRTWRYYVREPLSSAIAAPAVFVLAGIETGRESLSFIADRDDMIVLGMDYPYHGPQHLEGCDLLRALPALRQMAFETIEGATAGVTYLSRRADVDPGRIILLGVSFGSIFAVALGAHDARPNVVVLVYGGGDLPVLVQNLRGKPWWIPSFVIGPLVRGYFGELEPLSHVARIAPRYLLMVSSTKDEMFPPATAQALFDAAGQPKKLLWYETGHMDLFEPDLLRRLTSDVVAELETSGYLRARRGG